MPYQANLLPNTIHRKHLAFVDNAVQTRTEQAGQTQATDFRALVSGADTQAGFLEQKFSESALGILGRWRMQKNTAVDGSQTLSIALTQRTDIANEHVLQSVNGVLQWGAVPGRHDALTLGAANGLSLAGQALSLALATTLQAGAMSSADKTKLDGLSNYTHPASGVTAGVYGSATQVAQVTVDGRGHVTSASNVPITFPAHTHPISDVSGLQSALDGKSNVGHTHSISDVSGLQSALNNKSDVGHNHDDRYYTETESDARYAALSHNHDERYYTETESDARYALITHTHTIAQVSGLQSALSSKSDVGHMHAISDVSGLQSALNGKAATTEIVRLDERIDGRLAGFYQQGGTAFLRRDGNWVNPAISDVSGLQSALDAKSNVGHTHTASDTTTGVFDIARIPTGATSTTVALGNHTHDGIYSSANAGFVSGNGFNKNFILQSDAYAVGNNVAQISVSTYATAFSAETYSGVGFKSNAPIAFQVAGNIAVNVGLQILSGMVDTGISMEQGGTDGAIFTGFLGTGVQINSTQSLSGVGLRIREHATPIHVSASTQANRPLLRLEQNYQGDSTNGTQTIQIDNVWTPNSAGSEAGHIVVKINGVNRKIKFYGM